MRLATLKQIKFIEDLSKQKGINIDTDYIKNLTVAEASEVIEELLQLENDGPLQDFPLDYF